MKAKALYKGIFKWHCNCIEVCNIRQTLGLISEAKAEEANRKHCIGALKAAYFGGFATPEAKALFEEKS